MQPKQKEGNNVTVTTNCEAKTRGQEEEGGGGCVIKEGREERN